MRQQYRMNIVQTNHQWAN